MTKLQLEVTQARPTLHTAGDPVLVLPCLTRQPLFVSCSGNPFPCLKAKPELEPHRCHQWGAALRLCGHAAGLG